MSKNEVYDYLAEVYLDKQTVNKKQYSSVWIRYSFLIAAILVVFLSYLFLRYPVKLYKPKTSGLHISTGNEHIKLKYNFSNSSLQKEGYVINLSGLTLEDFEELRFQARHIANGNKIHLRVEIENATKEKSFTYISGLTTKWKEYSINLADFKEITDWTNITAISFTAEEWNVQEKDDAVYIDELQFIRTTED